MCLSTAKRVEEEIRLNCLTPKVYGHGGWWGWGKARFWRRFDDRASNNLMIILLTR